MKGDHRQPSAGPDQTHRDGQDALDGLQLLIDGDAQRLEGARGRVDAFALADGFQDQVCQRLGAVDRTVGNHRAGDLARQAFFAITEDDLGQFFFGEGVHQVGGGAGGRWGETHVERAVAQEGESALRGVQLHGRDAEVEKDAVHRVPAQFRGFVAHRQVRSLKDVGASAKRGECFAGDGQRLRVEVEAEQFAIRG